MCCEITALECRISSIKITLAWKSRPGVLQLSPHVNQRDCLMSTAPSSLCDFVTSPELQQWLTGKRKLFNFICLLIWFASWKPCDLPVLASPKASALRTAPENHKVPWLHCSFYTENVVCETYYSNSTPGWPIPFYLTEHAVMWITTDYLVMNSISQQPTNAWQRFLGPDSYS